MNKERFQGYLQIDGFTLYELGETGGVCTEFVIIYVLIANCVPIIYIIEIQYICF